jgi:hypothetical protein
MRGALPAGESRVSLFLEGAGRQELVERWGVRIAYR